jgi:hypothetical protein
MIHQPVRWMACHQHQTVVCSERYTRHRPSSSTVGRTRPLLGDATDVMIIVLVDFYSLSEHQSTKMVIMTGHGGADH